ncbi:Canalicular multispecific organic anion transporter 1 [Homalodisca vitripennis]|nr:Canalicular multispecific organic anion transporter 1 [Homalodisca vitripennis]
MGSTAESSFCYSTFWDYATIWDTSNPDLSLCFEKTVLVWVPCLVLWLLSPVEICFILKSKCRDIPWAPLITAKLLLNLVLIGISGTNLVGSAIQHFQGENVFPVDLWTPAIQTLTFILAFVLLIWDKVRGLHTSGVLFIFWLLLSVTGAAQFRTEIIRDDTLNSEENAFRYVLYMIYYPVVVVMMVINVFADRPPRYSNYSKYEKICPEIESSFVNRTLVGWFDGLIWRGFRKTLTSADLWHLKLEDTSAYLVPRFEKRWKKNVENAHGNAAPTRKDIPNGTHNVQNPQKKQRKPVSVLGPMLKMLWLPILTGGLAKIVADALEFINPQILNLIIRYIAGRDFIWKGILYAVTMFLSAELYTLFLNKMAMNMYIVGINWRTAIMSAVYKKALRISAAARKESTVGEVVNLMAVDAQRCSDFAQYIHYIWTAPISIGVALYFLWNLLGISTLAGLTVMLIVMPINSVIANRMKTLQAKQMQLKDERVKLVNEVLSGIKVLKLYAWEPSFRDKITDIREKELMKLRAASLWNSSVSFLWLCSSFLVSLATFGMFVLIDERHVLTTEIAFVSMALFNVMRVPIIIIPILVQLTLQFLVSLKRISKFMNAEELDMESVSHDKSRKEPLIIESGSFSWSPDEGPVLRNISLKVQPGKLVAVVGTVGSGKSSLISAFLGEMVKLSGYVNTIGKIAYVPQQAWIQNDTLKENILFGNSYESKKYFRTVENCALKADFNMLPGGDSTEIGEKGINLSGGQKQRVSLARAVYYDADIYLLDDPLSAVDSHVGKHIFENVIGPRGQLYKKTRILVTHAVTFLPQVDVIVVMKAGEISEIGTFKELMGKKGEFSEFLIQHITDTGEQELNTEMEELLSENEELMQQIQRRMSITGSMRSTSSSHRNSVSFDTQPITNQIDRLIQEESSETGGVKLAVYLHFIKSAGIPMVLSVLFFQVLSQGLTVVSSFWLTDWTSDPSTSVDGVQVVERRNYYLGIYALLGVGQVVGAVLSSFSLTFSSVMACRRLHLSMLTRVIRAPMSFFDTTPTGRLVNRFSKDMDVIDNILPMTAYNAMIGFITVLGTLLVITKSTPIFLAVIVPIALIYYFVQKIYVTTSRQLRRIEAVSRSPIYSHFSETVSGASSIRAYGSVSRFIHTLENRVDFNTASLMPSTLSGRWLSVRLETIGNTLIFFAALFAVLARDYLDPAIVGLSVSYALQITGNLNFAVRLASEVESNSVSIERVKEYSEVQQEAAWEVQPKPKPEWPNQGVVQFQDYQVRYREGLDLVLRGVTFTVSAGEKIGIVGRTGAGKSSLTLCLFRIIEAAGGQIQIDGVDISNIGLGDLRSKLTIIPQDPVLFCGTLRMNLDPFGVYSDSDVWRALQLAHLGDFMRTLTLGLQHPINEGGENLSVGQRQLVCLARALLRKTKLLILDEATAAVDLETDDLIQATIRREFRECTVLTIAHRLNTIMDSDRVLVLDKGLIKEFDSPQNLLKSTSTIFYGMAKDAGLT